jgi:alkylated DNA repair protein alkB family protein 7
MDSDLQLIENVISDEEEGRLAEEASVLLRRRRYEKDHWDSVIINFKEMETRKWSQGTLETCSLMRLTSSTQKQSTLWKEFVRYQ